MALSAVELYEQLKPHLGENETKALIEYVDEKIRGEVATKEDLLLLKADLKAELKEEIWKLRVLVIVVLVAVVVLNPKVLDLVGRVLGAGR